MENFKELNLVEMRQEELEKIEGGLAAIFMGILVGWMIGQAIWGNP